MRERAGYERPSAFVRRRGSFMDKGEQVYAGVPGGAPSAARGPDAEPARAGALARRRGEPADGARRGQPRVGVVLRPRHSWKRARISGPRGSPPSHPELLDWLATEFLQQEWRTKAIHKLIVTSATYRQIVSGAAGAPRSAIPTTACSPAVRVSGWKRRWCATRCWPRAGCSAGRSADRASFRRSRTASGTFRTADEKWTPSEAEDRYRRGLYVFIRRSAAYPSFMTFDATSREHAIGAAGAHQHAAAGADHAERRGVLRGRQGARALADRCASTRPSPTSCRGDARASYAFRLVATRTPGPARSTASSRPTRSQLERFRQDPEAAARTIKGYAVAGIDRRGTGRVDARRERAPEPRRGADQTMTKP